MVLDSTVEDLARLLQKGTVPAPNAVLVTGDIGNTGGLRSPNEYAEAAAWLHSVAEVLSLSSDFILTVPGNHDIQRRVAERESATERLLRDLREPRPGEQAGFDEALLSDEDRPLLTARLGNYITFSSQFNAQTQAPDYLSGLAWTRAIDLKGTFGIRIAGLNSAVLSADDNDRERLRLGMSQVQLARSDSESLVIVLTHHPLSWLEEEDRRQSRSWLVGQAAIHLHGHVHEAESRQLMRGAGDSLVTIVAGAIHGDKPPAGYPAQHGYNVASLVQYTNGDLGVRLWPRLWSDRNKRFAVDVESVPDGAIFADHDIRLQRPTRPMGGSAAGSAQLAARPATETEEFAGLLSQVSSHLLQRAGQRRTAYPTDVSIAELHEYRLFVAPAVRTARSERDLPLSQIADRLIEGQDLLLLGEPGSGKTVLAFHIAMLIRDNGSASSVMPVDIEELLTVVDGNERFSLTELLTALIARSASLPNRKQLLELSERQASQLILVVDGLDEALASGVGPADIARLLRGLSRHGTLLVTSRIEDYERTLASSVDPASFAGILTIQDWRVENEFADFLIRLVEADLRPNDDLLERVRRDGRLSRLVRRPLYARMLTFVADTDLERGLNETILYDLYLDKLASRVDTELRSAGRHEGRGVLQLWTEASWYIFERDLAASDGAPAPEILEYLQSAHDLTPQQADRVLHSITDYTATLTGFRAQFIHYSFYEFLVARHVADGLIAAQRDGSTDLLHLLGKHFPPEIRRFLVAILRTTTQAALYTWPGWLAEAWRLNRRHPDDSERRTANNVIAYAVCRLGVACGQPLRELLQEEEDPFLRTSLYWALNRTDDESALDEYLSVLTVDEEMASLNRGYLLYYFGDMEPHLRPPYRDDSPYASWSNTRTRSLEKLSSPGERSLPPGRQALDLYTFYDMARVRGQRLTDLEHAAAEVVLNRLRSILPEGPSRVALEGLHRSLSPE
jgi:hypothetical protein